MVLFIDFMNNNGFPIFDFGAKALYNTILLLNEINRIVFIF